MRVKLLVVQGRPQGKSLLFPRGEFVIGRGTECHIRPNSDWVSRQHCLLRVALDSVHLRDLGSRNGTLVNGTRVVGECRLANGDKLQIGPLVFQLELEDAAVFAESFAPEAPTIRDTQEMVKCSETQEMQAFVPVAPTTEMPSLAPSQVAEDCKAH
jgi:pSer/pThr/pTyr-binding forkhead associated (FHA) protein